MFNSNLKNNSESDSKKIETYVGLSVKIEGHLKSEGDIFINGDVKGGVTTKKNITIGNQAKINGNISGQKIIINGTILGNIKCQDRLELGETSKIIGDIETKALSVAEGALIQGQVKMDISENKVSKQDILSVPGNSDKLIEKKSKI